MPIFDKRIFRILERAEGFFAAAAWREISEPPFQRGRAWNELAEIREILAELQKNESYTN